MILCCYFTVLTELRGVKSGITRNHETIELVLYGITKVMYMEIWILKRRNQKQLY